MKCLFVCLCVGWIDLIDIYILDLFWVFDMVGWDSRLGEYKSNEVRCYYYGVWDGWDRVG